VKLFGSQAQFSENAEVPPLRILVKYLSQWLQKEEVGVASRLQGYLDIFCVPNEPDDMCDHLRSTQHLLSDSILFDLGFNDISGT